MQSCSPAFVCSFHCCLSLFGSQPAHVHACSHTETHDMPTMHAHVPLNAQGQLHHPAPPPLAPPCTQAAPPPSSAFPSPRASQPPPERL